MASLDYLSIPIPNLLDTPYVVQSVSLNNKLYFFEFYWNIRHQRAYLSIYYKQNGEVKYLLKSHSLVNGCSVSKYIYDIENWSGDLVFAKKIGSTEQDYRIDNLHEFFGLNYYN